MKKLSLMLCICLVVGLLSGCVGTTVVYHESCTCPTESGSAPNTQPTEETKPMPTDDVTDAEYVKTGLYIGTNLSGSANATAEEAGKADYDVTLVAVTVDDSGVIRSCVIDSIGTSVAFDAAGVITSDVNAAIATKNELGESYGMKAYAGSKYEWNEQAAAVAEYAVGKTAAELRSGAVTEAGKAKDADLATVATIYIGGYVEGIIAAAENARHLGAKSTDVLKLAALPNVKSSKSAEGENAGLAQLDVDVTALTMDGNVISSCYIDSLQAKVSFDATGTITTDLTAPVATKNQLGENYGMKKYAGSAYEWNEQAAAFAAYVTGLTAAEVEGIAVNEGTKPTDADLAATVTIAVGGYKALVVKAATAQ